MQSQDIASFYEKPIGKNFERFMRRLMQTRWPDLYGLKCAGVGYFDPYMDLITSDVDTFYALHLGGEIPKTGFAKNIIIKELQHTRIDLPAHSLEVMFLLHGLEHVTYPELLLRECAKVLAPGGKLIVVAPNLLSPWSYMKSLPMGMGAAFYRSDIKALVEKAELDLVREYGVGRIWPINKILPDKLIHVCELMPFLPAAMHVLEVKKPLFKPVPLRPRRRLNPRFGSAWASS